MDAKNLGATVACPRCEYDLRENTTSRCPECGGEYTATDVSPKAFRSRRRDRFFRRLSVVTALWPLVWVADGVLLRGRVFIDVGDRFPGIGWVPITFLDAPLYMLLALLAYVATRTDVWIARRFGAVVTTVLLAITVGQVVLSIGTLL